MKEKNIKILISVWLGFLVFFFGGKVEVGAEEIPQILPRSTWATADDDNYVNQNWPPSEVQRFQVQRILIHDTGMAALNNDSLDPRNTIRSIFTTHAKINGWGDIGYNYIIDRQGRVYEGRMGGNGIRGSHLYVNRTGDNFNYHGIGIVLLGRYGNGYAKVPVAQEESLTKLVGWLSSVNSIEPNEIFTSKVWNYHAGGYKDDFTGYRVLDHGNVEAGNGDTNMLDMNRLRTRASSLKQEYDKLVYRDEYGTLYRIWKGVREIFLSGSNNLFANISWSVLNIFPVGYNKRAFLDDTLIRSRTGVAYLQEGKKRPIIRPEVFDSRFNWKDVVDVSETEWNRYSEEEALTMRNGMLVRETNSSDIYFISNGKRYKFTGPSIFEGMGFRYANVVVVPDNTVGIHPDGGVMQMGQYLDGTLITSEGKGVELLENGKRRPIPTPEIFDKQFRWSDLVKVSGGVWDSFAEGEAVYYPNGTLIREKDDYKVYITANGKKHWITSQSVFNGMGYKWNNIEVVSNGSTGGMLEGTPLTQEVLGLD
jgi:hypothetical protein